MKKTDISSLSFNPFEKIGKEWMLVGVTDGKTSNAMTASWGQVGFLWNKPVFTCFIRPQRYTFSLLENSSKLSVAFFSEEYRNVLTYFGKTSGRDVDKIKEMHLNTHVENSALIFDDASLVLEGKVLLKNEMKDDALIDKSLLSNYEKGDFHYQFICEIENVYEK